MDWSWDRSRCAPCCWSARVCSCAACSRRERHGPRVEEPQSAADGIRSEPGPPSGLQARQLLRDILDSARAVPGRRVRHADDGRAAHADHRQFGFVPEEHARRSAADRVEADIYAVGPDFFATMGIPFLAGQDFPLVPAARKPVIVNEAFARAAFPTPVTASAAGVLGDGRTAGDGRPGRHREITHHRRGPAGPRIYLPLLTSIRPRNTTARRHARREDPNQAASYALPLREAIRRVDPVTRGVRRTDDGEPPARRVAPAAPDWRCRPSPGSSPRCSR